MSLFIIDFDYRFPPTHLNNSTKLEGWKKESDARPASFKTFAFKNCRGNFLKTISFKIRDDGREGRGKFIGQWNFTDGIFLPRFPLYGYVLKDTFRRTVLLYLARVIVVIILWNDRNLVQIYYKAFSNNASSFFTCNNSNLRKI